MMKPCTCAKNKQILPPDLGFQTEHMVERSARRFCVSLLGNPDSRENAWPIRGARRRDIRLISQMQQVGRRAAVRARGLDVDPDQRSRETDGDGVEAINP